MSAKAKGTVLVTGASSGIGRATAMLLDRSGYRVFAGVRRNEDADALRRDASERLAPLELDITRGQQIEDAVEAVSRSLEGGEGLAGLVNNAGIATAGPLEFVPIEQIRRQLDVNVVGTIAVIQAFLPLLRPGPGRIVQIGSAVRDMSLPFLGAYTCSKVAVAAASETFRRELRHWKIPVIEVLPGIVRTPMWDKYPEQADRVQAGMPRFAETQVGAFASGRRLFEALERRGHPPEAVARVVRRALEARWPRLRYTVGMEAFGAMLVPKFVPDRALDWIIDLVLKVPSGSS